MKILFRIALCTVILLLFFCFYATAQTTTCNCGIQNTLHFDVSVPAPSTSSTYIHRMRFNITLIPAIISLSSTYQIKAPGTATYKALTLDSASFQQIGLTNWYARCYTAGGILRIDVAGYQPVLPYGPEDDTEVPTALVYQGTSPTPETWVFEILGLNTLSMSGINTTLESWNYRNSLTPQWSNTRIASVSSAYLAGITNNPCNTAPTISALTTNPNPATGNAPLSVAFSATATSPNTDGTFTFFLDHGNSTSEEITGSYSGGSWQFAAPTPTPYSYANPGIYFASIAAKDKYDTPSASSALVQITVNSPTKPICGISYNKDNGTATTSGAGGLSINFDAVTLFPSGCSIAATNPYSWNFDDSGTSNIKNPSHTFYYNAAKDLVPGDGIDVSTYNVTLQVTGTCGVSDSVTKQILVYKNLAPVPSFTISSEDRLIGVTLTFNGTSSTDPNSSINLGNDGSVAHYSWQVQKKNATGGYDAYGAALPDMAIVTKTFTDSGKYRVNLIVTDDKGLVSATTATQDLFIYRNPKELMVVVDHSGSMTMGGKWETAMTSAELFINIMNGLDASVPAYAKDKLGIVCYTGTGWLPSFCLINERATPGHIINTGLKDMPFYTDATNKLFDFDAVPDFSGQIFWNTPTGEGLAEALDTFNNHTLPGTNNGSTKEKSIVVLTDGQNNTGWYDLAFTPGGTCDVRNYRSSFANQKIKESKIYSIVVGQDTISWPEEVSDLSSATGAEYRTTENPGEVVDYFSQILSTAIDGNPLVVNKSAIGASSYVVSADYPEDKYILAASWKRSEAGGPYFLKATNGTTSITSTSTFVNVVKSSVGPNDSYGFYIIDNPINYTSGTTSPFAGTWTLELVNSSGTSTTVPSAQFYAIADLHLDAQFTIDKHSHTTGESITLTARITEDGKPVTGADVRANCNNPVQPIGETLSTYALPADQLKQILAQYQEKKMEPPSIPYIHMQIALKEMGKKRLPVKDSGIVLHDDGINGDRVAKDGIYTAVLKDVQFEGNYIFDFLAKGATKKGKFARKENLATYVTTSVSQATSIVTPVLNQKPIKKGVYQVALVIIPKDKFKNRLGPYHTNQIQFAIRDKSIELDGGLNYIEDHKQGLGGVYTQNLIVNTSKTRSIDLIILVRGKETIKVSFPINKLLEQRK
jgi:hypothetical protein